MIINQGVNLVFYIFIFYSLVSASFLKILKYSMTQLVTNCYGCIYKKIFNQLLQLLEIMSKKAQKHTGWPGDCSPQQLQALDKFKVFVADYNGGKLKSQWDEHYLLRFLRARKFNQADTEKMWKKFIQWRVANDIDNAFKFHLPEIIAVRKQYPHGYHKTDKLGRPIYIERVGFLNVDQVFKFTTEERLLKYYALSYETLLSKIFDACTEFRKKSTGEDKRIQQTCTILDLKDVKLGSASKAYNFVKPASAMAQDNYPEILGNMFIINAPFLFTGIWAIVKVWIDDKTKQKIKILGSSYKKQLLEYIEPENLPSFIDGGKCKCEGNNGDCLSWNIGPWNPEGKEMFQRNIKGEAFEEKAEVKVEKVQEQEGLKNEAGDMKKVQQVKQQKKTEETK